MFDHTSNKTNKKEQLLHLLRQYIAHFKSLSLLKKIITLFVGLIVIIVPFAFPISAISLIIWAKIKTHIH